MQGSGIKRPNACFKQSQEVQDHTRVSQRPFYQAGVVLSILMQVGGSEAGLALIALS